MTDRESRHKIKRKKKKKSSFILIIMNIRVRNIVDKQ